MIINEATVTPKIFLNILATFVKNKHLQKLFMHH